MDDLFCSHGKADPPGLIQAADLFVFRPTQEVEALALESAVSMILHPFHVNGIIVGPDGTGSPIVKAGVTRSRSEPGLYVDLMAQVRPWYQQVSVRVMVKSGTQPQLAEQ